MNLFFNRIFSMIRYFLIQFLISAAVLFTTQTLLGFFLTWWGPGFVSFFSWLGFVLSAMEKIPLSVGGGVGPSNRPLLDLNLPPAPEPEPAPPGEEALYNEKDPNRIKCIIEKQKQEREVSNTKNKIFHEKKKFDETMGMIVLHHFKRKKGIRRVNKKCLSVILENKTDGFNKSL